ncbi:hypothetical protein Gotur_006436 [Gossypium turneri]
MCCNFISSLQVKLCAVLFYYNLRYSCFRLCVQTILNNLKLLFDEYVKNSKSTSSSLTGSSNILDNNPIDSSLHQLKVNRVDLGEDYDESASKLAFSMEKKVIISLRSSLKPKIVEAIV